MQIMKRIQITVKRGENFSPASLMKRYADITPGAEFCRGRWGGALLVIAGTPYTYHHWSITAEDGNEVVTLYLEEGGRPC